ncbi:hypothetical protein ID0445_13000 [Helicobacter pylori]
MLYHYSIAIDLLECAYSFFVVIIYSPNNFISIINNISIISYIFVVKSNLSSHQGALSYYDYDVKQICD